MFTNEICPYKSHADHCHKSCDAFHVAHVGVLDVESGSLHGSECSLNLPPFLIGENRTFRTVETYQNLQFRHSVGVLYPASGKIDILPFVKEEFVVELLLSDPEVIEQPPCTDPFAGGGLDNPEVLPDTDVISDAAVVEPSDPAFSDEFPVGHNAVNAIGSEQIYEPLHNFLPFLPIGIATLREKTENQWKGYAFIGNTKHKDIDVEVTELPVGPVHAQDKIRLDREQGEYHPCDNVEVENILGEESLKPSEVGILVDGCRHGIRKLMEADCLYHTQRMEKQRHELYARQIHRFAKMLLHDRKDLVNFDRVLGSSGFHGEKSVNFSFKLLISKDFCKYNQLKFRCLTA